MLYKNFESIHNSSKENINQICNNYENLTVYFDKVKAHDDINKRFKENKFYTFDHQIHKYYNKYLDETCNLVINNRFAVCKCNNKKLELLKALTKYNLFICDFDNKDYFWLDEIYC